MPLHRFPRMPFPEKAHVCVVLRDGCSVTRSVHIDPLVHAFIGWIEFFDEIIIWKRYQVSIRVEVEIMYPVKIESDKHMPRYSNGLNWKVIQAADADVEKGRSVTIEFFCPNGV